MRCVRLHRPRLAVFASLLVLAACASPPPPPPSRPPDPNPITTRPWTGARARMGVARFKDVSARPWWTREIAAALADELAATLAGTGRLVLLGSDLAQSLAYEESGNGGAAIDELEGSALVVLATLTEYRGAAPDGSGPRDGPARVGMQLRLVDPGTARIVASSHVVGESGGAASAGSAVAESRALGPALAALAGTPAEEALRRCLREAASFVLSATPESYFRER